MFTASKSFFFPRALFIPTKRTRSSVSFSAFFRDVQADVLTVPVHIMEALNPSSQSLKNLVRYQFDTQGKLLRPLLITLLSACCNYHSNNRTKMDFSSDPLGKMYTTRKLVQTVSPSQHRIALVTQMIHCTTLIHDDLLDSSDLRRGQEATYRLFGHKEAVLTGSYILIRSLNLLSELADTRIFAVMSQAIRDLVNGELMQLSTITDPTERFEAYLSKTYRKTGTLFANSLKAAAMWTRPALSPDMIENAHEFGRHLGLALQFIDDMLDAVEVSEKSAVGADLEAGIATAPAIFAARDSPELEAILQRQFSLDGDKERASKLVKLSNGIEQTRKLANFHFHAARQCLLRFRDSDPREGLLHVLDNCMQQAR